MYIWMISLLAPMYNIVRNCRILFCCSFMSIFLTHPIYAVSNIQTTEIDSLLGVLKKRCPIMPKFRSPLSKMERSTFGDLGERRRIGFLLTTTNRSLKSVLSQRYLPPHCSPMRYIKE